MQKSLPIYACVMPRDAISDSITSNVASSSQISYGILPSAFTANKSAPLKKKETVKKFYAE